MILMPSIIKIRNRKIRISLLVTIVELSLLTIGLIWMFVRGIPVFENIRITPGAFLMGIVAGFVILGSSALFYVIDREFFDLKMKSLIEDTIYPIFSKVTFPEIVLIAVLSGFCEEFFFRGILVPEFGIIVASIIFGFLHTPSKKNWFMGVWSSLAGAVFAILYVTTGNLFVPMVAHVVNNFAAILYIRFVYPDLRKRLEEGEETEPEALDEEADEKPDEPGAEKKEEVSEGKTTIKAVKERIEDEIKKTKVKPRKETAASHGEEGPPTAAKGPSPPEMSKEEKHPAREVSSPVRLLSPEMIEGKIPRDKKIPVREPEYEPMSEFEEEKEPSDFLFDLNSLLGRKKDKKKSAGKDRTGKELPKKRTGEGERTAVSDVKKILSKAGKKEVKKVEKPPEAPKRTKKTKKIKKEAKTIKEEKRPAAKAKEPSTDKKKKHKAGKPKKSKIEKPKSEKKTIGKDRRADDLDDEGIGIVHEPQ